MIEGHIDQQRVDTTTSRSQDHRPINLQINNISLPHGHRQSIPLSQRTNATYSAIMLLKHHTYSDQTGKFLGK